MKPTASVLIATLIALALPLAMSALEKKDAKDVLKASSLQMWWTSLAWRCDKG